MGELLVDEFNLPIDPPVFELPQVVDFAPEIKENVQEILISGPSFKIIFNKYSGQITEGSYLGNVIITGGPYLQLLGSNLFLPDWWPHISLMIESKLICRFIHRNNILSRYS